MHVFLYVCTSISEKMDWAVLLNQMVGFVFDMLLPITIIGAIIIIILDNRNPVKSLAWILVLVFLPIVGLILYYFFGRDTRRIRIINKKTYGRMLEKPMAEYLAQQETFLPHNYSRLISLFRNNTQALPFDGNDVEIYTSGNQMLDSLMQQLEQATKHIHLQFYIFEDDSVGQQVKEMLMRKARQGVEVRVLYDDVGCWHVSRKFFQEMEEAGVQVHAFLEVRFPRFASGMNYRNHRKVVVIDGEVGYIGGMNLADRYVNGVPWGIWRDTHVKITGKAVHGLQTIFLLDWYFVSGTLLTDGRYFPSLDDCGDSLIQIVAGSPVGPWREIMQGLTMSIALAKNYFYIQTPYFMPTESVRMALTTAAVSGVDVRLMIPRRADSWLVNKASRSYLRDMLQAGVKVYFYEKGFLHSKLLVSDDMLSSIGSANIDFRSFEHNLEANAFIYDEATATKLRELFLADQRDCTQLSLKSWKKRPWYNKFSESVVRLLSPLL